ncbi:MAG: S41 family peptidase [Solirubrobacteraceae bacterium]
MSKRSQRSRPLAPLVLALVVALLAGILLGGHPSWLPSFVRSTLVSQSKGDQVQTVLSLVSKDYYRPVSTQALTDEGLQDAIASLNDPYSHYFPPAQYRSFMQVTDPHVSGIGVVPAQDPQGLLVQEVFPGSPAAGAGLGPGQVIVAVGPVSLAGRSAEFASNLIRGRAGTTVTLTVLDGKRRRTVKIIRQNLVVPVAASKLLRYHGVRIGYVELTSFTENAATELRVQVDKMLSEHAQALILDLRENGGGLLEQAVAVASIFIPDGTIVTTRGRNQPTQVFTATGGAISTSIPMVVLVDHGTASSAEIVTAALQDHDRAKVVGTHTYGKGVFQEIFNLSGGAALDITVGEFFTPDGRNLGGAGVASGHSVARGAGVTPNVYAYSDPSAPGDKALTVAERVVAAELP